MKLLYTILVTLLLSLASPSQDSYADFVKAFDEALQFDNEPEIDRAIRSNPASALGHFTALSWDLLLRGDRDPGAEPALIWSLLLHSPQ